jgi:PsbP
MRYTATLLCILGLCTTTSAFLPAQPAAGLVRATGKLSKQVDSTEKYHLVILLDSVDGGVSEVKRNGAPKKDDVVLPERGVESASTMQQPRQQYPSVEVTDMMRALGTSPRRVALSFLSSTGIALAGNFLGVTSKLLTAFPEATVESSGLDIYFPRGDFKRCRSRGYTFVIPKEWVADTFVELAKAQRNVQPLDLQMKRTSGGGGTLPDSAYGPPGRLNEKGVSESGDTNVSVIVTSGLRGFSLRKTLGDPNEAAEKLLRLSIAPEDSGRVATLLSAVEDKPREVYQFEFNVDRGSKGPPVKNISVVAATPQGDKLFTLTVVAPLQQWNDKTFEMKCRKIASSFHLTS